MNTAVGIRQNFNYRLEKMICERSCNSCPAIKQKNSKGVTQAHKDGKIPGWTDLVEQGKVNRGWSKGLTKDIDPRVARPALVGKRFGASLNGHTEETKNLSSQIRIKHLESVPHIKWIQLSNGIKVQGNWELNVGERLLSLGYLISRPFIKFDNHRRYTPDFCIGLNVYVEVKGWMKDSDILKYRKVLSEHPQIKIYLIRNEFPKYNYSRFISSEIYLEDCEDLREVVFS